MRNLLSISNFKRREPLLAIALFAGLVVVLETTFALLPPNKLVKTFRADRLPAAAPDWQIMGDSVAQGGILAEEVEKFLPGQTVYNAALAGTGPEFSYFVLRRQIAAGRAPKAILYAPSPHTFASDRTPVLIGGYCRWRELPAIAATGQEPCDQIYGVLCKLSYTLRYRDELGGFLRGRGNPEEPAPPKETNPKKPDPVAKHYTVATIHPMYKKPFAVNPLNGALFEKFLQLAQANRVAVYWATLPVLPAVHAGREPFHFDEAYAAFLAGLHERHGVQILSAEFPIWDETQFKDMTHLNRAGAETYSRELGQRLAALAPPQNQPRPPASPR